MANLSTDMQKRADLTVQFIVKDFPRIVKVEALRHFKKSFINEGFTDGSLKKWKKRTTIDKSGRNITRYKTNRIGKAGALNDYGKKTKGRPVLTGFGSGGNKLRNSLKARIENGGVTIYTYKKYAEAHNEGDGNLPKREFMGPSRKLDEKIEKKIEKQLNKIFK